MVFDTAAGKERDVDVTVTVEEEANVTRAFKAYEVKHEGVSLDVAAIEQLCLKLLDMPSVTHRAIVSSSGFTAGAKTKAAHHGVELYEMEPWTGNLEDDFPTWDMAGPIDEILRFRRTLLVWRDWKIHIIASQGPASFNVQQTDRVLTSSGDPHPRFNAFAELRNELLLRSTEILFSLEPAQTTLLMGQGDEELSVSPSWPHTHTLDITSDQAYVELDGRLTQLEAVTINGHLQWEHRDERPEYHIMRRIPDGEVFAGALVALGIREGQMYCFVLSPSSLTAGVHIVHLNEKQMNLIRKLKIEVPNS
jgi:hypothetical protein